MSQPEQNQGAPAALQANAVSGEAPLKQSKPQADEPTSRTERLAECGVIAAFGVFVVFVLLPHLGIKADQYWPGSLAAFASLRACDGLRCTLDALGLLVQLVTYPFVAVGCIAWWLLEKRHPLLAGVFLVVFAPVFGHLVGVMRDKMAFVAFIMCFALSQMLGLSSGKADAGLFILMGFSAGWVVLRQYLRPWDN